MREQKLPPFDPKIADSMSRLLEGAGGLVSFLGAEVVEFAPGRLRARMEVRPDLVTRMGAIHGGVMAGFVDHVLGCVVYPHMEEGRWAATTEFKLNYLAPVREGVLEAEAEIVAMGKRSAVVRCEVWNGNRLACVAQGTLLIADPPARRGAREEATTSAGS